MKLILNPEFNLYEKSGKPFCDSLMVAETFEKEHKEILKTLEGEPRFNPKTNQVEHIKGLIDNLLESGVNTPDYFIKVKYKDSRNRSQPKYLMSRDGFTLLVMGFTGAKALKFKLDYITRFNQMDAWIQVQQRQKIEVHPALMDSIKYAHAEPKQYHYSNEQNMIYKIVLGVDAKTFREMNGLEKGRCIKPYLTTEQIKAIETLQRIDIGLIEFGIDYHQRKVILAERLEKRKLLNIA